MKTRISFRVWRKHPRRLAPSTENSLFAGNNSLFEISREFCCNPLKFSREIRSRRQGLAGIQRNTLLNSLIAFDRLSCACSSMSSCDFLMSSCEPSCPSGAATGQPVAAYLKARLEAWEQTAPSPSDSRGHEITAARGPRDIPHIRH